MKISLSSSTFLIELRPLRLILVDGRNILFANCVKYLDVIFSKRITLGLHKEMVEAKALKILESTPYSKLSD
jgi:hypothetical protein